ncbi:ORF MSV219 hypothetical protein [Melanoplus sanguinipes entomopoxvirus]|uniref:Uncharacterized protein n=1 Tax=Melanoplus sanguinipes entomopoxvirus TaxID=83191 RepID=Q9YVM3_MSEPV|nr:ORF MSV219 hypothetical protein [Melanoplus sanguinipes entomopoxvirus]AAC97704.1 ORF MSV219 hypothetical protein [Melanoplus sanguinipes entomopoxvirus 'O']
MNILYNNYTEGLILYNPIKIYEINDQEKIKLNLHLFMDKKKFKINMHTLSFNEFMSKLYLIIVSKIKDNNLKENIHTYLKYNININEYKNINTEINDINKDIDILNNKISNNDYNILKDICYIICKIDNIKNIKNTKIKNVLYIKNSLYSNIDKNIIIVNNKI